MMIFSLVAMIGLEKCCITSACLQWLCHSGERTVARGPLVYWILITLAGNEDSYKISKKNLIFAQFGLGTRVNLPLRARKLGKCCPAGPRSLVDKTLNPLGFSPLWFEPRSGHMWESQVLLTDGQVVFLRVLRFSPTFDERSARYK